MAAHAKRRGVHEQSGIVERPVALVPADRMNTRTKALAQILGSLLRPIRDHDTIDAAFEERISDGARRAAGAEHDCFP